MRPMLATPTDTVPAGATWRHEVKWDGMRLLAGTDKAGVRLTARSGADATVRFPELHDLLLELTGRDALFDGEVVSLGAQGPSFARLADRIHVSGAAAARVLAQARPVTYLVFDVLRLDGLDLLERPWQERRAVLESIDWPGPRVITPPVYDDGDLLLRATLAQCLEGIVSKRVGSRYVPGRRSPDWRKHAHRPTRSVVVGGWRPETGSRRRLGAVLVGAPGSDGLHYLGRVGSGLGGRAGDHVAELLAGLESPRSPFSTELPAVEARGATWVTPRLVVEVRSLGLGGRGRLRQPSFQAVRADLTFADLMADDTGATRALGAAAAADSRRDVIDDEGESDGR